MGKRIEEPGLLTTAEVAALLRIHPKHVYRLLKQGLPALRLGADWRFQRSEVLRWSEARGRPGHRPEGARVQKSASPASASRPEGEGGRVPPLLAANGDVLIDVLLHEVRERAGRAIGLWPTDSTHGMDLLRGEEVMMSGAHGEPLSVLPSRELARIHLARREVGVAFGRGRGVKRLEDLRGKRLASRPESAGVRAILDRAAADRGLVLLDLAEAVSEEASHRDAVLRVVRGEADVALTTRAWAALGGLDFLTLADEAYELVVLSTHLGEESVTLVAEIAQSLAFRRRLDAIDGYDPRECGTLRVGT